MPANLADAMIRLLDASANEGLTALSQILKRGQSTLGQLWTSHLSPQDEEDLRAASTVLPGLKAVFEAARPNMQRDSELLAGTQCSALADNALSVSKPIGGWGQYVVNTLLARCACLLSRSSVTTTRLPLFSCATRLSPTR